MLEEAHVHVGTGVLKGSVSFQHHLTILFILGLLGTYLIPESPYFPWVLCGINKCWSEDVNNLVRKSGERGLLPGGSGRGWWSEEWTVLFGMEMCGPVRAAEGTKERQPLFSKVEDSWFSFTGLTALGINMITGSEYKTNCPSCLTSSWKFYMEEELYSKQICWKHNLIALIVKSGIPNHIIFFFPRK